jgi:hypothetical protein
VTRAAATGFLGALLVSGFVGLCGTECAFAQIRGTVTDEVGATIHGAKVHVMEADTWKTVRIVKSDSKGRFEIYDLTPGQYKIAFTVRPFKPETLDVDTRAPGADADRSVRLKVLDCDGPGINCDSFFSSTPTPIEDPHPVAFNGSLTLKVDDALDLDHGRIVRDDASGAGVKLTETNGALYLEPLNRTAFLDNCDAIERGRARKTAATSVKVTGLFEDSEICLKTRRGRVTKIYLTNDVERSSKDVRIYLVTRK